MSSLVRGNNAIGVVIVIIMTIATIAIYCCVRRAHHSKGGGSSCRASGSEVETVAGTSDDEAKDGDLKDEVA
jgi:hypothetical protein